MHSHDRTLLAKLGFADPDKKNPEHDQACLYLRQPETLTRLSDWMRNVIATMPGREAVSVTAKSQLEYHLQKGEGEYATTIGFLDAVIEFRIECNSPVCPSVWPLFAEVKIEKVGIGNLLRQMNLYAAYIPWKTAGVRKRYALPCGIVLAPWGISDAELEVLHESGYAFLTLGEYYREWQQSQTS